MLEAICGLLYGLPVELVGATTSPEEASAALDVWRPDLILLDLAHLNKLPRRPGTKVLVLTIYEGAELQAVAKSCESDGVLSKAHLNEVLPAEIARLFP